MEGVKYSYTFTRTRVIPVIDKFVESIFLHVVNVGKYKFFELPVELDGLCQHPMTAPPLAAIIMEVQKSKGDIMIMTDKFPPDLVSWLLVHFHGQIEIFVGSKMVYTKTLEQEEKKLKFLLRNTCSTSDSCLELANPDRHIEVSVFTAGAFKTVLKDNYSFSPSSAPSDRQRLYSLDVLRHWQLRLDKDEKNKIRLVAQEIVKWLLNLPVKPRGHDVGFLRVTKEHGPKSRITRVADLFAMFRL